MARGAILADSKMNLAKKSIEGRRQHQKSFKNILSFLDYLKISFLTKKNVISFFNELAKIDPLGLTHFELSFKANKNIIERGKIRILNLDAKAYSYLNEKNYLQRLDSYFSICKKKISNPVLINLFNALRSVSATPLDVYLGADIKNNDYLLAFWLIFGGVKRNGRINFISNSDAAISKVFNNLNIKKLFSGNKKILNLGFDIDNKSLFYKIYYFLDKNNLNEAGQSGRRKIKEIIDFLGNEHRYWFFISERYKVGAKNMGRKKVYVEFLDDIATGDEKTLPLLRKLLGIMGCNLSFVWLKGILSSIPEGKIVILAFEPDGTTTFYIRL